MGGYSPVAICEGQRWVVGDPKYKAAYRGRTYWLANDGERQRFLTAPRRVPACCGNDPVVEAEQARHVSGTLDHSALWKGRLYLFASAATFAHFRHAPGRYADASQ